MIPTWIQAIVVSAMITLAIASVVWVWKQIVSITLRVQDLETRVKDIILRCSERAEVGQKVLQELREIAVVFAGLKEWLKGNERWTANTEKRLDNIEAEN